MGMLGPDGVELITRERREQQKSYSDEHDDDHAHGELAMAAAELAFMETDMAGDIDDEWGLCRKYEHKRLKQLIVAGALICAEIDRLHRLGITE